MTAISNRRTNQNEGQFNDRRREQYIEAPLPSSEDSERVIIGAILLDNGLMAQVIEILRPEHFYSPLNRRVYAAMVEMFKEGKNIDTVLILEQMKKDGPVESIGGSATLANMTFGLPHFSDISAYVKVVVDYAGVRDLIRACNAITSQALAGEDEPETILETAQAQVNQVCTREHRQHFHRAGALARESVTAKRELRDNPNQRLIGVDTGFSAINHITNGWQKTDLIVLAGRPSMGKSALAGNLAENACKYNPGAVVAVFTHEMSKEQYIDRMIGSAASIDVTRYRQGHFNDSELQRIEAAALRLNNYAIEIDDSSGLSPLEIRAKLLTLLASARRLDLVIIDFLQKMHSSRHTESRQQEVSSIARELKTLAKDLRIPIVALSSLSRECEKRKPPKPLMSDLRESGDIESEADIVAFLYRENYYNASAPPTEAEMIFAKNRHGDTPIIKLNFIREFTRFEDLPRLNY